MSTSPDDRALKELICEEATRLFALRGFAGTSVRHVVDACQCTKPALYYYFPSKEALYREIVQDCLHRVSSLMEATLQGPGTTRERLHRGIGAVADHCIANPLAMRLVQRVDANPEDTAPPIDMCANRSWHMQLLSKLMCDGIDRGELRADLIPGEGAMLLTGAIHFQFEMSSRTGDWDLDRIHRSIDLLIDGLSA